MASVSRRSEGVSALAAATALALILIGGFQSFYLQIFVSPRANIARSLKALRFRKAPLLEPFAEGVLARTPPGSSVALVFPFRDWTAYAYHLNRASYILAGRRVLPTEDATRPHPEIIERADYIAAWPVSMPAPPGWVEVWRGNRGVLLKRVVPLS